MSLYLLNDEYNSFEFVINALSRCLPLCNIIKAESMANIVHTAGECQIYSGFAPEIYILYATFQKAGLMVELRTFNKTNKL